jgi:hypothetical protein
MSSLLNYATIDDLSNLLLVTIDPSFEPQVNSWISAAENYVNQYLGYTTASGLWNEEIHGETLDARVDGDLNLVIFPRKKPVNSVSAVALWRGSSTINLQLTNNNGQDRFIQTALNNSIIYPNYELTITGSNVYIRNFAGIKFSRWFTKMDYIAGYTEIPPAITLATSMVAADTFMRHANREGLSMIMQGRLQKRWQERRPGQKSIWISDAENILAQYRLTAGWF